ncbi:MAG: alkaline phosphatase family protein [Herpetosiphonaceae bacterium]|nr:alkaline phosphatase family protein [Herpetosiphonaceae bacterium]
MKASTTVATLLALGVGLAAPLATSPLATSAMQATRSAPDAPYVAAQSHTVTPIKHVVVIFQENVSFDHYFGTYPKAQNPGGEPKFVAAPGTPPVNGLSAALLTANPNAANPQRLDRSQALTCDQDHGYTAEQQAFDNGLMDKFVESASGSGCTDKTQVMDYYDGNTVTGLWNYAQHFAMSDNSFGTTFGPSTPGALNLVSGQTHGATPEAAGEVQNGTVIGDPDPAYDACSGTTTAALSGRNIGDLLNGNGITWGWFQGGFTPSSTSGGTIVCGSSHVNIGGATVTDYSAHHEPFQYYQSTANPSHLPPSSIFKIGKTDQANHQYDLSDFWAAASVGNMPAVSFLKASKYQDGHASYSDPLDEQHFLVDTLNRLQHMNSWKDTAVIIAYDDSDGWYDHVMSPIVSMSDDPNGDALSGPGMCGTAKAGAYPDRCGYGPRLPLLVISPYAKTNFVDHTITDQSSILRFIEGNWSLGRIGDQSFDQLAGTLDHLFDFTGGGQAPTLFLDPFNGLPIHK